MPLLTQFFFGSVGLGSFVGFLLINMYFEVLRKYMFSNPTELLGQSQTRYISLELEADK